ncbi:MAG: 3-phosphoshikimate 1-carboxyvinyltransferase [Gammaproteobacteria bacterium]|nr:3-phosphoshikimate 1-carboxyvinyltransferase [Gammaproteobacteria bacterium]
MANYHVQPSKLQGDIVIPPSKSHTLRAILFATMAQGVSTIRNYLSSLDTVAMIDACRLLGAEIKISDTQLTITGCAGKPQTPADVIDAGNSGQVLRFVAAIAALTEGYTVITGDESIRNNRPIQPLLDGLTQAAVLAVSSQSNGYAPVIIKGPLRGGATITINGEDSQPVSGILMAAAFASQPIVIQVTEPGEKPWIDLTLAWFDRLDIAYQRQGYSEYTVMGNTEYAGFDYTVPGDFSSCAFPVVAALITASAVKLHHLDPKDAQGDKALLSVLQTLGADLQFDDQQILSIRSSGNIRGRRIEVNDFIDAVPILAVLACFIDGETVITGAAIARHKESDRLAAISEELKKMGANIVEDPDGLRIKPAFLTGARVSSHHDHRIAMALAVAGMAAEGETIIEEIACVDKSYPGFAEALWHLGAKIEVAA